MKNIQKFTESDMLMELDAQAKTMGKMVFGQCFAVKPTESVLVVTVPEKQTEGALLFEAAKLFSNNVTMLVFTGMTENAQEPPKKVAQAMQENDVVVLVTRFSLSHTRAREMANTAGARVASLPGITFEMMARTLSADYKQIAQKSEKLATLLTQAKTARLTSPAGTDLTLFLEGRAALADTGELTKPGSFGNLPAGEAFIAPVEGKAQGVLVIDGCLADVELDAPITVTIKDGEITDIQGGAAASVFAQQIAAVGKSARVVAELGIGTNEKAIVDSDVLEAEKVLGTCHIAFGDNAGFGGNNEAPFHSDGVVLQPTLSLDGVVIINNGEFEKI